MSNVDTSPLSSYNSLLDKNLAGYFGNSRMRRHLRKNGLINRRGELVSENQYRLNMARKEHKKHVKDLLAQAIVHKSLDLERYRQVEIKKKLEEIAKIELVRRVRASRGRQGDEEVLPYLSPRSASRPSSERSGRSRPKSAPAPPRHGAHPRNGYADSYEDVIYVDNDGNPVSPPASTRGDDSLRSVQPSDIDTRHLYALDSHSLQKYALALSKMERGDGATSPYLISQVPTPPRHARSRSARSSGRRAKQQHHQHTRPISPYRSGSSEHKKSGVQTKDYDSTMNDPNTVEGSLMLHRQEPAMHHQGEVQTLCEITMKYHGPNLQLPRDQRDPTQEVSIDQQHCGGNTLPVFRERLQAGSTFTFISRRHRGFPFSLTLFIDGRIDCRVSTCCEYKHAVGVRLGGKMGHFSLTGVTGATPCYKCKLSVQAPPRKLKVPRSKTKKSKAEPIQEEVTVQRRDNSPDTQVHHQAEPVVKGHQADDDYDDDFEDDDSKDKKSYEDDFEDDDDDDTRKATPIIGLKDDEMRRDGQTINVVEAEREEEEKGDIPEHRRIEGYSSDDEDLEEPRQKAEVKLDNKKDKRERKDSSSSSSSSSDSDKDTPRNKPQKEKEEKKMITVETASDIREPPITPKSDRSTKSNRSTTSSASLTTETESTLSSRDKTQLAEIQKMKEKRRKRSSSSSSSSSSSTGSDTEDERKERAKRLKEEEEKRKREELQREEERKRRAQEEERVRQEREDERKRKLKEEQQKQEEQKRKIEEERRKKEEEERERLEEQKRQREMERKKREEEEQRKKEEENKRKEEERRKRQEEEARIQRDYEATLKSIVVRRESEEESLASSRQETPSSPDKRRSSTSSSSSSSSGSSSESEDEGKKVVTKPEESAKPQQQDEEPKIQPKEESQTAAAKMKVSSTSSSSTSGSSGSSSTESESDRETQKPLTTATMPVISEEKISSTPQVSREIIPPDAGGKFGSSSSSTTSSSSSESDSDDEAKKKKMAAVNGKPPSPKPVSPPPTVAAPVTELKPNPETTKVSSSGTSGTSSSSSDSETGDEKKKMSPPLTVVKEEESKISSPPEVAQPAQAPTPSDKKRVSETEDSDSDSSSSGSSSSDSDSDSDSEGSKKKGKKKTVSDSDADNMHGGNDPDKVADAGKAGTGSRLAAGKVNPAQSRQGSIYPLIKGKVDIELSGVLLDKDQVSELSSHITEVDMLKTINVYNTGLDDTTFRQFSLAMQLSDCPFSILNLGQNRLGPESMQPLSVVVQKKPSLRVLHLNGNPIGDAGLKTLLRSLIPAEDKRFSFLRQSSGYMTPSQAREATPDEIEKSKGDEGQSNVQELDLADTGISDRGIYDIAQLLEANTSLTSLNLNGNKNVTVAGWARLGDAMAKNVTLRTLSLDFNNIGDEGIKALTRGLVKNRTLVTLELESSGITDIGAEELIEVLKSSPYMKQMTVTPGNNISEEKLGVIRRYLMINNPGSIKPK